MPPFINEPPELVALPRSQIAALDAAISEVCDTRNAARPQGSRAAFNVTVRDIR